MNTTASSPEVPYNATARSLSRPVHDRLLTGTAAGIANYLGLDTTVVRIVLAVLAVAWGAGIPIYVVAWLLIPETGADQSIAGRFISQHRPRSI